MIFSETKGSPCENKKEDTKTHRRDIHEEIINKTYRNEPRRSAPAKSNYFCRHDSKIPALLARPKWRTKMAFEWIPRCQQRSHIMKQGHGCRQPLSLRAPYLYLVAGNIEVCRKLIPIFLQEYCLVSRVAWDVHSFIVDYNKLFVWASYKDLLNIWEGGATCVIRGLFEIDVVSNLKIYFIDIYRIVSIDFRIIIWIRRFYTGCFIRYLTNRQGTYVYFDWQGWLLHFQILF